jgi:uncharacterized protein (UPF0305 family)
MMIYHYEDGKVRRIVESTSEGNRIVFEYKDTRGELERHYRSNFVEKEIMLVQSAINELLDLRNQSNDDEQIAEIDERLRQATHQLFVMEA